MTKTLSQRKREAIVNAAVSQFLILGFANTSMDKIALTAKVSKRTVYNHFASKDELFSEILELLWQQTNEHVDYHYSSEESVETQLTNILAAKLELLASPAYLKLAKVVLAELIHSPEKASNVFQHINEKEQGLYEWLSLAVDDKKLDCDDIEFAAAQLHGLIKASAFWPQVLQGKPAPAIDEVERIIKGTVSMFLGQYLSTY